MKSKIIAIIPARMASRRLPGKMLAVLLGKSLIQRTYENALQCTSLDQVIIATDHSTIFDHVKGFGGHVEMSSPHWLSGSDRVAEVARKFPQAEIVVNIQGDEPCLEPEIVDHLVERLQSTPDALIATAVTPLEDEEQLARPSIVKCVMDQRGKALYFSRSQIPYPATPNNSQTLRHIGVYAYRASFLQTFATLSPTPLQLAEDLEQLKILEHGYPIHLVVVANKSIGVDTSEDLIKVEEYLCKKNTSLSPVV